MPPKKGGKKKGKGKGKGKGKKGKRESSYVEVGRQFYEKRIADMNSILADQRSKHAKLDDEHSSLINHQAELIEDEKDIIAYLNRMIQRYSDDINSIQNDCYKVAEERVREAHEFENQKQQMQEDAAHVEEHLLSDLKLTFGMSHALEEFRLLRDELMRNYEELERQIDEQNLRHKNAIYEVEKMFIIGEDKLKREMDSKLRWLIEEFQAVTDLRVSATTQRVIKENIVLNNVIEKMLAKMKKLYEANEELEKRDEKLRLMTELTSFESGIIGKQSYSLQLELFQLMEEYYTMDMIIKRAKNMEPLIVIQQETRKEISKKINDYLDRKSILEQHLHEGRCQREDNAAKMRFELNRNEVLKDMLRQVAATLDSDVMTDDVFSLYADYSEDHDGSRQSKSTVLYKIHTFLKQVREWNRYHTKTIETLEDRNDIYMEGSVGLVPRKVILKSMMPIMIERAEQTDISLLDIKVSEDSWSVETEEETEEEVVEESIVVSEMVHEEIEEEGHSSSTLT